MSKNKEVEKEGFGPPYEKDTHSLVQESASLFSKKQRRHFDCEWERFQFLQRDLSGTHYSTENAAQMRLFIQQTDCFQFYLLHCQYSINRQQPYSNSDKKSSTFIVPVSALKGCWLEQGHAGQRYSSSTSKGIFMFESAYLFLYATPKTLIFIFLLHFSHILVSVSGSSSLPLTRVFVLYSSFPQKGHDIQKAQ